ncbi:hypothetical protein A3K63_04915 [Candidatus Micrarchaeota archaeon RBG_16_49_10]|nr:MAG: hypothetical protein A3K63_04915 [Candidatus Micrarchaeota archaeon RBG_16_49_10]
MGIGKSYAGWRQTGTGARVKLIIAAAVILVVAASVFAYFRLKAGGQPPVAAGNASARADEAYGVVDQELEDAVAGMTDEDVEQLLISP